MQGHHLYNFCRAQIPFAVCKVSRPSNMVLENKVFKEFLPYMSMAAILVM